MLEVLALALQSVMEGHPSPPKGRWDHPNLDLGFSLSLLEEREGTLGIFSGGPDSLG